LIAEFAALCEGAADSLNRMGPLTAAGAHALQSRGKALQAKYSN
jgi:hypothetical protein